MMFKAGPDIVKFLSGENKPEDQAIHQLAGWYLNAAALEDARYWCYAVIGHGTPGTIAETHISDAIQKIAKSYQAYGNGRVLLVLSCALGYGSARVLARRLKANVIAARTTIQMYEGGAITLKPTTEPKIIGQIRMPMRRDWIYVKPNGTQQLNKALDLDLGSAGRFFDL